MLLPLMLLQLAADPLVTSTAGAVAPVVAGTASTPGASVTPEPVEPPLRSPSIWTRIRGLHSRVFPGEIPMLASGLPSEIPAPRDVSAWTMLSPSVSDAFGNWDTRSISGGTPLENKLLLDGIDLTNTGSGTFGPWLGQFGELGAGLPRELLGAVSVAGAGPEVEAPGALGGVVDARLPRGATALRSTVFLTGTPENMESRRRLDDPYGSGIRGRDTADGAGILVRGPLFRDATFAVGSAFNRNGASVSAPGTGAFPLTKLGVERRANTDLDLIGHVSVPLGERHTLEFTGLTTDGHSPTAPQFDSDMLALTDAGFRSLTWGMNAAGVQYDGTLAAGDGGSLRVQAGLSRAFSFAGERFPAKYDTDRYTDFRTSPVTRGGGVGFYDAGTRSERNTARAEVDASLSFCGRMDTALGAEMQQTRFDDRPSRTGYLPGRTFVDESGTLRTFTTGTSYQVFLADDGVTPVFRVVRGDFSDHNRRARGRNTSLFLRERWSVSRVTLDAGVRLSEQSFSGVGEGHGSMIFPMANGWAPRGGVSIDAGYGVRAFARWSRVTGEAPLAIGTAALDVESSVSRVDYSSANFLAANQLAEGATPVNAGDTVHVITQSSTAELVDRNLHPPTIEETEGGVDFSWHETLSARVRGVHRSLVHLVEDYGTVSYDDILSGAAGFGAYHLGNPAATRDYDALEFSVAKRFDDEHAVVLLAYRLSQLRGNTDVSAFPNAISGLSTPSQTEAFDFPDTPLIAGNYRKGLLAADRTHVVRAAAAWRSRTGPGLGAVARISSGAPRTTSDANLAYGTAGTIVATRRGDRGREPLLATLDAHADWLLAFRHARDLTLALDLFNVFDSQTVIFHDDEVQFSDGSASPAYGSPVRRLAPRTARFSLRLDF